MESDVPTRRWQGVATNANRRRIVAYASRVYSFGSAADALRPKFESDRRDAYPTSPVSYRYVAGPIQAQTGSLCSVASRVNTSADSFAFAD